MPALSKLLRHSIGRRLRMHRTQCISRGQADQESKSQFGKPDDHCPTTLNASCPEKLAQFSSAERRDFTRYRRVPRHSGNHVSTRWATSKPTTHPTNAPRIGKPPIAM